MDKKSEKSKIKCEIYNPYRTRCKSQPDFGDTITFMLDNSDHFYKITPVIEITLPSPYDIN